MLLIFNYVELLRMRGGEDGVPVENGEFEQGVRASEAQFMTDIVPVSLDCPNAYEQYLGYLLR